MRKTILMLVVSFLCIGTTIAKTTKSEKEALKRMKKIESFEKTKESGLESLDSYVKATKDIAMTLCASNKTISSMQKGEDSSVKDLTISLTALPTSIANLSSKGESIIEDCKKETNPMKQAKYIKLATKTASTLVLLGQEASYQIETIKAIQ